MQNPLKSLWMSCSSLKKFAWILISTLLLLFSLSMLYFCIFPCINFPFNPFLSFSFYTHTWVHLCKLIVVVINQQRSFVLFPILCFKCANKQKNVCKIGSKKIQIKYHRVSRSCDECSHRRIIHKHNNILLAI